jgi:hypothetical protein
MDWDVIYSYSRKQAIEDGILVDISKIAHEAGFTVPAAITSNLYEVMNVSQLPGQSVSGRLWDVLTLLRIEARGSNSETIIFDVIFQVSETEQKLVKIKAVIGPGDTLEPVLTLMYPHED